jgi:hypothetical protein
MLSIKLNKQGGQLTMRILLTVLTTVTIGRMVTMPGIGTNKTLTMPTMVTTETRVTMVTITVVTTDTLVAMVTTRRVVTMPAMGTTRQ